MGWATEYVARLKNGEQVPYRPRGHSMNVMRNGYAPDSGGELFSMKIIFQPSCSGVLRTPDLGIPDLPHLADA
jgi:hypothetical protein